MSLLAILNDTLDSSKIEAGQMHIEKAPFDLRQLVEQVIHLVEITAHEKGLVLRLDHPPELQCHFEGDPRRITQILTNLLGNAVKFTAAGEVSLIIRRPAAGRLSFAVQDTGSGMSPLEMERLFQPFSQADSSTTRRVGGTGLGLIITKQLVELMQGHIEVSSEPGRGSCFSVEIEAGEVASPDSDPCAAAGLAHIDTAYGLGLMGGNERLYRRILTSFAAEYAALRLDLNHPDAPRTLHSLKGLSANIGAMRLHDLARDLEESGDATLLPAIHRELAAVLTEARRLLATADATSPTPKEYASPAAIEDLFEQIRQQARAGNSRKCREAIDRLSTLQLTNAEDERRQSAATCLRQRDYQGLMDL